MARYYDITLPITDGMIVYPGDDPVHVTRTRTIAEHGYNWSSLSCGTHLGTHVDAPNHFVEQGKTLDDLPLDLFLGKVAVVEIHAPMVTREVLATVNLDDWRAIFFKTRNQSLARLDHFSEAYVSLTPDAAEYLVHKGTQLVGIDYRSIESFETHTYPVHHTLLGAGAWIIEGLDLRDVPEGMYRLHCLPLKLEHGDGGPVRAILEGMA